MKFEWWHCEEVKGYQIHFWAPGLETHEFSDGESNIPARVCNFGKKVPFMSQFSKEGFLFSPHGMDFNSSK